MKIILAAPRGFCAGVNMAIESLDLAIRAFGTPIYVYHEIVHNKYVVETFRAKGAVFVDDLAERRVLLRRPADDGERPDRPRPVVDLLDVQYRERVG